MRLLLITNVPPHPEQRTGAGQRTELLRRALARWGEVDLLIAHAIEQPEATTAELRPAGGGAVELDAAVGSPSGPAERLKRSLRFRLARPLHAYFPRPPLRRELLDRLHHHAYDAIVGRYLLPAVAVGLADVTDVPRLLDADDLEWRKFRLRAAAKQRGPIARARDAVVAQRFRRFGIEYFRRLDHVWLANVADRPAGLDHVSALLNLPFDAAVDDDWSPCPPAADSKDVLFVGDLAYTPNKQGLRRFVGGVWPRVRAACPAARLLVVGSRIAPDLREWLPRQEGVEMLGFVEDLRDAYTRCAVTVAPVWWGGGTKIKVLESLAYGRCIVATPHAAAGLEGLDGDGGVATAESDDAMAAACTALLADPAARAERAAAGYDAVQRTYSFARFCRAVDEPLSRLLDREVPRT